MDRLITVSKAKQKAEELLNYIELAESYEADTLEKLIIKEYAYTNSINQVLNILEERGVLKDGRPVEKSDVVAAIKSRGKDPLHQIIRRGYLVKIRCNKR